jgi:hypothetical protein
MLVTCAWLGGWVIADRRDDVSSVCQRGALGGGGALSGPGFSGSPLVPGV